MTTETAGNGRAAPAVPGAAAPPLARVLVVDDDPVVLRAVGWLLKEQGYDARTGRGAEALFAEMERERPDVLVMDVSMNGSDGLDVLRRVKGDPRWADLPVIVASAVTDEARTVQALEAGADDYVAKPLRVRELMARLHARLRTASAQQDVARRLASTATELDRARDEAGSRRAVVEIVEELSADLSVAEIYAAVARRLARVLGLARSSVVLARPGDATGRVAAAYEQPEARDVVVRLERYPEIAAALTHGRPVVVEDVRTSPLLAEARRQWAVDGVTVDVRSSVVVPFQLDRRFAGVVFLRRGEGTPALGAADADFARAVVGAAAAAVERAERLEAARRENARLESLAHTDPLTATFNRRALTLRLRTELERARRYGTSLSLLVADIDGFKAVNDEHGHLVGDEVLRRLADVLRREARAVDVVARYGGEEFVLVLPQTDEPGAMKSAERLRERVEAERFEATGGAELHLTVSVGVASFPARQVETAEEFFAAADAALYRAKADGRNRVRT